MISLTGGGEGPFATIQLHVITAGQSQATLVIDSTKGRIVVEMRPDVAPDYVERIKTLTRRGFYDGLIFFRVVDTFMAQTGDPLNNGKGQSDLPNLKDQTSFRRGPGWRRPSST